MALKNVKLTTVQNLMIKMVLAYNVSKDILYLMIYVWLGTAKISTSKDYVQSARLVLLLIIVL